MNISEFQLKKQVKKSRFNSIEFEIYPTTSLSQKQFIANSIVDFVYYSNLETGEIEIQKDYKHFNFVIYVINEYTNIQNDFTKEIDGQEIMDSVRFYEFVIETGLWDFILDNVSKNDIEVLKEMIDTKLADMQKLIDSKDTLENKIERIINNFVSQIPTNDELKKLLKDLPKAINKFDVSKLDILSKLGGEVGVSIPTDFAKDIKVSKEVLKSVK